MTAAILEDALDLLVGAITGLAGAIGSGANAMVTGLLIDSSGSTAGLSSFGGTLFSFTGIALAIGFTTKIFIWLTSFGN